MVAGDRVFLKMSGPNLIVENSSGQFLGQVEPKYGQRLIRLMKVGNEYSAAIVSSTEDKVTVIIREIYQHPSQAGQLSFPPRGLEGAHPHSSERRTRRELEYEEELVEEPGYTIIGDVEEPAVLPEEPFEIEE